jgi:hypothetical protein
MGTIDEIINVIANRDVSKIRLTSTIDPQRLLLILHFNTDAMNLITSNAITPHPIPLPSGARGG